MLNVEKQTELHVGRSRRPLEQVQVTMITTITIIIIIIALITQETAITPGALIAPPAGVHAHAGREP